MSSGDRLVLSVFSVNLKPEADLQQSKNFLGFSIYENSRKHLHLYRNDVNFNSIQITKIQKITAEAHVQIHVKVKRIVIEGQKFTFYGKSCRFYLEPKKPKLFGIRMRSIFFG